MCAAIELNKTILRPGGWICVWAQLTGLRVIWAGFARRETMNWWRKNGAVFVDVPAERFAERSDVTRELRWDDVPRGQVVRGIIDHTGKSPVLKVVTRASDATELARFEHPRMPLIETPLFSAEQVPAENLPPATPQWVQGSLF
jgi:hypothetical protein